MPGSFSEYLTPETRANRDHVLKHIFDAVKESRPVLLPKFVPETAQAHTSEALITVGLEDNPYGFAVGPFRCQFEGEEDLLHLIITRSDLAEFQVEVAQQVASFALPGVSPALIWLKPGIHSHHFYLGHDDLVAAMENSILT